MVAPFGQERGATPQGGPGKPVAMAGRGQGRGQRPLRIRRPIGPRRLRRPRGHDCTVARGEAWQRGCHLAPLRRSPKTTDGGTGSGNLKRVEMARRTTPARGRQDPKRGHNSPKAAKLCW